MGEKTFYFYMALFFKSFMIVNELMHKISIANAVPLSHWPVSLGLFTEFIILLYDTFRINMWTTLDVVTLTYPSDNFKVVSISYFLISIASAQFRLGVIKYYFFSIIIMIYSVLCYGRPVITCDASISISIRSLCAGEDIRNISISFSFYAYAYAYVQ